MGEIQKQILPLFSYALYHNLCSADKYNELFVSEKGTYLQNMILYILKLTSYLNYLVTTISHIKWLSSNQEWN